MVSRLRFVRVLTALTVTVTVAGCSASVAPPQTIPTSVPSASSEPSLLGSQDQGLTRSHGECEAIGQSPADLTSALVAVNGEPFSVDSVTFIETTEDAPTPTGAATNTIDPPLQLLGGGQSFLATSQVLPAPTRQPASSVGRWDGQVFHAFGDTTMLADQLPEPVVSVPLAGNTYADHAVWVEQLAPARGAHSADLLAWRVMTGDGSGVRELTSSWQLTGLEELPASTPYVGPVSDGKSVFFEATLPVTPNTYQQVIVTVPLDQPGVARIVGAGRLPTISGGKLRWVEDNTMFGLDAQTDRFTIHRDQSSASATPDDAITDIAAAIAAGDIILDTGDFFKVQGLVAADRYLVVALQDTCSARTWMLRYDLDEGAFTAAFYSLSNQVALSASGAKVTWGNGSGSVGPQLYYWDLTGDTVMAFGENPGYSVPFVAANGELAIPAFPAAGDTYPRVFWTLTVP